MSFFALLSCLAIDVLFCPIHLLHYGVIRIAHLNWNSLHAKCILCRFFLTTKKAFARAAKMNENNRAHSFTWVQYSTLPPDSSHSYKIFLKINRERENENKQFTIPRPNRHINFYNCFHHHRCRYHHCWTTPLPSSSSLSFLPFNNDKKECRKLRIEKCFMQQLKQ